MFTRAKIAMGMGMMLAVGPALAGEKTLTMDGNELFQLQVAIGQLQTHQEMDAGKHLVSVPYEFGPGASIALATDYRVVGELVGDVRKAAQGQLKGTKSDAQVWAKFSAVKHQVTLETVKLADLDLAKNPITPSALAALIPLIDN